MIVEKQKLFYNSTKPINGIIMLLPLTHKHPPQMAKLMGFSGFGSTKETKVQDNYEGAAKGTVQRKKERKYRQYMNRKGGFNRPLDQMK